VTGRLAALPQVEAVTLGGSRATRTHRPGSDWDFAVYYRGPFSPASVRALGWPGEVSEIGGSPFRCHLMASKRLSRETARQWEGFWSLEQPRSFPLSLRAFGSGCRFGWGAFV
jgi:hypothetical protein